MLGSSPLGSLTPASWFALTATNNVVVARQTKVITLFLDWIRDQIRMNNRDGFIAVK